jgi:hypothetical protein
MAGSLKNLPAAEQETVQRAMRVLHKVFDYYTAAGNPSPKVKP